MPLTNADRSDEMQNRGSKKSVLFSAIIGFVLVMMCIVAMYLTTPH